MTVDPSRWLPRYDADAPAITQQHDWDCSEESAHWMLCAYGRDPSESWMEASLIETGTVTPAYGLMDASGFGMAAWLNDQYGDFGYLASNDNPVSFDELASEAGSLQHPLMIGGRAFYHWVGLRGYDPGQDILVLANPAPGYRGVYQELTRSQFAALGSFSLVRLTHPEAEDTRPPSPPPAPPEQPNPGDWDGRIGSGLLAMMARDSTYPAQAISTWLPLGQHPASIEEAYAVNGTRYVWLLGPNQGFRYVPS